MFDEAVFGRKLRALAAGFRKRFGDLLQYDVEEELARFEKYRQDMRVGSWTTSWRAETRSRVCPLIWSPAIRRRRGSRDCEGAEEGMQDAGGGSPGPDARYTWVTTQMGADREDAKPWIDADYGTYPFVTSSNTSLGGIFTGVRRPSHPKPDRVSRLKLSCPARVEPQENRRHHWGCQELHDACGLGLLSHRAARRDWDPASSVSDLARMKGPFIIF